MRCAYCNGPCDERPVRHEALCRSCHGELTKPARKQCIVRDLHQRFMRAVHKATADSEGDGA